jgi:flavin-binding protein dodecin
VQITKTVRLTGESADSIEGAIASVLERATASLRAVETYEVVRVAGRLTEPDGWVHEVTVDVTFGVKDATAHQ